VKDNKLTSLPNEICHLKKLEQLFLSYNDLKAIPDSIGNLVLLEHLYLGDNDILFLPASTARLVNVKYFYLGRNELSTFPEALCSMTRLKELDLAYCGAMGFLPNCLDNIDLLDVLMIDNNQTLPFPLWRFHNPSIRLVLK
jgi:Leucine-rich repeat (LRR) protein